MPSLEVGSSYMRKSDEETIRTFICIEIPTSIKQRIEALQRSLQRTDAQVSWVKVSNIHLTLKFLGDVVASRIERLNGAVERGARAISQFEIEVGGAGCFPSSRSPRVVWIGLTHVSETLARLHERIEDELAAEGFDRESREFSPHLTIGRVRAPHNARQLADALVSSGFGPECFRATEIIVMRSDLKPTGAVYSPLAIIKLAEHVA